MCGHAKGSTTQGCVCVCVCVPGPVTLQVCGCVHECAEGFVCVCVCLFVLVHVCVCAPGHVYVLMYVWWLRRSFM